MRGAESGARGQRGPAIQLPLPYILFRTFNSPSSVIFYRESVGPCSRSQCDRATPLPGFFVHRQCVPGGLSTLRPRGEGISSAMQMVNGRRRWVTSVPLPSVKSLPYWAVCLPVSTLLHPSGARSNSHRCTSICAMRGQGCREKMLGIRGARTRFLGSGDQGEAKGGQDLDFGKRISATEGEKSRRRW